MNGWSDKQSKDCFDDTERMKCTEVRIEAGEMNERDRNIGK